MRCGDSGGSEGVAETVEAKDGGRKRTREIGMSERSREKQEIDWIQSVWIDKVRDKMVSSRAL